VLGWRWSWSIIGSSMTATGAESRQQEIIAISRGLKAVARD
jgi:hypothetical protein